MVEATAVVVGYLGMDVCERVDTWSMNVVMSEITCLMSARFWYL